MDKETNNLKSDRESNPSLPLPKYLNHKKKNQKTTFILMNKLIIVMYTYLVICR